VFFKLELKVFFCLYFVVIPIDFFCFRES
jgi:hypothetical protein